MNTPPSAEPFTDNLIHFARYLRTRGLPVTSDTAADLLTAALAVGLDNPDDAYCALRAVSITRPDHQPIFNEAWDLFFGSGRFPRTPKLDTIEFQTWRRNPTLRVIAPTSTEGGDSEIVEPKEVAEQMGASYSERLAGKDFTELSPEDLEEVRRIMARMIWQPAESLGRRWVPARSGARPDPRRTFRNLVGSKADLLPLAFSTPRPRRRPLLVLADVSGSMERYVEMLLYFIHAARGRLGRLEAFVFATHLTRITRQVRHRDPRVALSQVAAAVNDWSGGTRIGESLEAFNREWSRRVVRGGPIALIISDGWDRGDPQLLRKQMGILNRSVHRVIWLNPLAGRPGFAPETQGMQAALPFIDDFLPAANLRDLREVIRTLESVPGHRRPRPLVTPT